MPINKISLLVICALLFFPFQLYAVTVGSETFESYLPLLEGKRVGLVVNHSSLVEDKHLLDVLLEKKITVKALFSPEHGFQGNRSAGESIDEQEPLIPDIPIFSLYGKTKKPTPSSLVELDVLVFDIQDVGLRFYTYLSTLHYVLEAGAETKTPVIVLDRPNPNIMFIDGPILDPEYQSFVGMHPIPVLHGMTLGELAQMIQGEGWINRSEDLDLSVIPLENYTRKTHYSLPIPPSPNLPNDVAVKLYASLCWFEPTAVSIGRGTDYPFQMIGHNQIAIGKHILQPVSRKNASKYPKLEDEILYARLLKEEDIKGLDLDYFIRVYNEFKRRNIPFFIKPTFFDKLAGTNALRAQIEQGLSSKKIKSSWQAGLSAFTKRRKPYLLYQ